PVVITVHSSPEHFNSLCESCFAMHGPGFIFKTHKVGHLRPPRLRPSGTAPKRWTSLGITVFSKLRWSSPSKNPVTPSPCRCPKPDFLRHVAEVDPGRSLQAVLYSFFRPPYPANS